jgi:nitroreductase
MDIRALITKNRSYRRFRQEIPVDVETLRQLVDLARLSASGSNLQPLKYILSCERQKNAVIFPHLGWAGYLRDWQGPAEGERPAAYIIILGDKHIVDGFGVDHGIAAHSILLGATEKGLGGCIIGSVHKPYLRRALQIPDHLEILLVIALGQPDEKVEIEETGQDGDIKYWRDSEGVHHVPKRSLDELIISNPGVN